MWLIYGSPPPACSKYLFQPLHTSCSSFSLFFLKFRTSLQICLLILLLLSFLLISLLLMLLQGPFLSSISCPSLPPSSARVISLFTVSHPFPLILHPFFSNYSLAAACFSLSVPISALFFLSCAPALAICSALSLTSPSLSIALSHSLSLAVCSSMKLKRFKPLFNQSLLGKVLRWQKVSIPSAVCM